MSRSLAVKFTGTYRCTVRHRVGSDAQALCPVHGDGRAADVASVPPAAFNAATAGALGSVPVSSVPGYDDARLTPDGDAPIWTNAEGRMHRVDGPAFSFRDYAYGVNGEDEQFVNYEYRIDGDDVTAAEVYGRFMEAMSDGVVPSTDMQVLRDMLAAGALAIDERSKTISVGDQRRFDSYVDEYARIYATPSKDRVREVTPRLVNADWDNEWDSEWVDGEWRRHRPFGKAIPTENSDIAQWYWNGEYVGLSRLIGHSLHEASDGAIPIDNYRAIEYVAAHSEVDPGGALRLKAYPHHDWKTLAAAIARQFPMPEPGEQIRVKRFGDVPGERDRDEWLVDGKAHRVDGPAVVYASGREPVYALDGQQVRRGALVARMAQEAIGEPIEASNEAAVAYIEEHADIDYGDADNDYTITVRGDLAGAARLAVVVHRNL